jgi:hypothetical protein
MSSFTASRMLWRTFHLAAALASRCRLPYDSRRAPVCAAERAGARGKP